MFVLARGVRCSVCLREKCDGIWKDRLTAEGWIGKNGLGKSREGDGKTPVGLFHLTGAFGVRENPGTKLPYVQVGASHYFVDDPASRFYNQMVSVQACPEEESGYPAGGSGAQVMYIQPSEKDWNSAEHPIEMAQAYASAMILDYNRERIPGRGSGIFLHCDEGRPTAGCIAVPETAMVRILRENVRSIQIAPDTPRY